MITKESLLEAFEGMDDKTAATIVALIDGSTEVNVEGDDRFPQTTAWINQCYHTPSRGELVMSAINELLGGFGVETIVHPNSYDTIIAEYINLGDTYDTTIVRDLTMGTWWLELSSWGDWLQQWEEDECEEKGLVRCGYCSRMTPIQGDEWSTTTCESCGRCVSTGEMPKPELTDEEHAYKRIVRLHGLAERSLFYRDPPLPYRRTLKAIWLAAKLVINYEWDSERLWWIGESGACSLSDLIIGAYWFCCDYNSGQWSEEYAMACTFGRVYKPGMTCGPEEESGEADVYAALESISGYSKG